MDNSIAMKLLADQKLLRLAGYGEGLMISMMIGLGRKIRGFISCSCHLDSFKLEFV
jgi:hypothetical protein